MPISKLSKWKLARFVRENPGIPLKAAAETLGLDHRTLLKHARRSRSVTVERGKKGRGHATRLWNTYDLPSHLSSPEDDTTESSAASSNTGLQWVDLDEI